MGWIRCVLVWLLVAVPILGTAQQDAAPTIRINVDLVEIDAVVTNRKGEFVTDLAKDDFEVFQDGKAQRISHFQYVRGDVSRRSQIAPGMYGEALPGQTRLKPKDVVRTIALVVDDLNLSFTSMVSVRQSLRRFVDEQTRPGDLVAILRTSFGRGALHQFTSDRRQLYAAIQQLNWRFGAGAEDKLEEAEDELEKEESPSGLPAIPAINRGSRRGLGTFAALSYIIAGLKNLPGRKTLILFSDGLPLPHLPDKAPDLLDLLIDYANRARVVIYTVYAPGVQAGAAPLSSPIGRGLEPALLSAADPEMRHLVLLAKGSAGLHFVDNDVAAKVAQALDDQQVYYLIGYRPEEGTFGNLRKRFHHLEVRVKRPGLHVRSRGGFYEAAEEDRAAPKATEPGLAAALVSPFVSNALPLRLTPIFSFDPAIGHFVYCILHVEKGALVFSKRADGSMRAGFEAMLASFDAMGIQRDVRVQAFEVHPRAASYERIRSSGLFYNLALPIREPGAYQLRAAVCDRTSSQCGSAAAFLHIPNVKKNRLALSGIWLAGNPGWESALAAAARKKEGDVYLGSYSGSANPLSRVFSTAETIYYSFRVFNARPGPGGRLELETQWEVFRAGDTPERVFESSTQLLALGPKKEPNGVLLRGALAISVLNLQPGDYVLRVKISDKFSKQKSPTAAAWVDFSVQGAETHLTPQAAPAGGGR
ncbi:MAG TPA: VWA domain-containing protein [Bryobacteraceae bacterium]|nr:VWA domain-containing protein [Bryobacteraceae bacterium]